jgi:16S rRNA G966 N2-methylase RsmD
MDESLINWINEHLNDDPLKLRLKYRGEDYDNAITQIECRKKTAKKLHKTIQNKGFYFPSSLSAEQSTSDDIADIHASLISHGKKVIDLTSGLGIDVFHIAPKASHVTAIEINETTANALSHNARVLGLENISVVNTNCIDYIANCTETYDCAYIDPARRGEKGERTYALHDCSPNVVEMLPAIKKMCRHLIIKMSPMLDITNTIRELHEGVKKILVIGTKAECKELVAVIDFNYSGDYTIEAHTVGLPVISFKREEETNAIVSYSTPSQGAYLIEPHPVIMKAAPIKLISERFHAHKLHANTHLYISETPIDNSIGESYKIIEVIPWASSALKKVSAKYPQINVAVRNLGISADALKKKLKVKDGGNLRLMGVTMQNNEKALIILEPIN